MIPEFRVWNKETKKYATGTRLFGFMESDDSSKFALISLTSGVFEWYTGLKDVNGNKIFEGDIVHCENDYEGTDYTGKVMFFNGGFCVWTGGFRNYVWDDMIPEIVGNVHENLELLEVE